MVPSAWPRRLLGATALDPVPGADGTAPTTGDLRGSRAQKTGLYALETVDIFNLLCLPGVSDPALLADAIAYCEERRAFCIVDLPAATDTLDEARLLRGEHARAGAQGWTDEVKARLIREARNR